MATTESPVKLGVFRDRALAEQAVEELRHAGFRDDEIRVWGQGAPTGGTDCTKMHTRVYKQHTQGKKYMTTTGQSMVVGSFEDRTKAEKEEFICLYTLIRSLPGTVTQQPLLLNGHDAVASR